VESTGTDCARATGQTGHCHRREALSGTAIAELTLRVRTPALDSAASGQSAAVVHVSTDGAHATCQAGYFHRREAVAGAAVAKLAGAVATPALDTTSSGQGAAVLQAGTDDATATREAGHVHRREALSGAIVAKLPEVVATPTLDTSGGGHSAAVLPAGTDSAHATAQAQHVHGREALSCAAIAELAEDVRTPALDTTSAGQSAGVAVACADCDHSAGQTEHVHRRKTILGAAVANLANNVAPPALDTAASSQRAAMVPSRGDGRHIHQRLSNLRCRR